MADDITVTPGAGATIAADDVGGKLHQRVKLALGADGTAVDAVAGAGAVGTGVQRITLASDDPAVAGIGGLTETAPATDTASSGLNGRLQRIAQRLTSLIALLPTSLGAQGGLKIEGVAAGTAVPVSGTVAVSAVSGTTTISGTVTANAGTNLNTSALALESGGNLAAIPSRLGEVQASPTANTVLDRLKALLTGIVLAAGSNTIGRVDHTTTGVGHGVKTVSAAGTDEALAGSTAAKWVMIQAQTDNTGYIAVGAAGVDATVATGTGVLLAIGESITIPCDNLADIYIDATVTGDGVRYTYGT